MNAKKKNYTVEINEGEAEEIDQYAAKQGVSTPDFIVYCAQAVCFGINYAVMRLAETGQVGKREKD
jgi:hypothetical protein